LTEALQKTAKKGQSGKTGGVYLSWSNRFSDSRAEQM